MNGSSEKYDKCERTLEVKNPKVGGTVATILQFAECSERLCYKA